MARYLTSDWHVGEKQTPNTHSYLRPWPTEEMVEAWLAQAHNLIKPKDTLIFLGDLGITLDDLGLFTRLPPCEKILILGDKEYNNKAFTELDFLAENEALGIFDKAVEDDVIEIAGREYFLSHKPLDCFGQSRPALCGHVHGIWRTQKMPNGQPIINVGIDAWGGLVSEAFVEHQYGAIMNGHYDANAQPTMWHTLGNNE